MNVLCTITSNASSTDASHLTAVCCWPTPDGLKREAEKRIKDIDEIYVALDEAAKMQAEAEEMQRKAEAQQKEMEEKMKKQEAEQQYVAAQKLDPSNPSSYFNLGLLYQDYKDGQKPSLHTAQDYYRQFLKRQADEGGFTGCVHALHHGARDEHVLALLLGSKEFFDRE